MRPWGWLAVAAGGLISAMLLGACSADGDGAQAAAQRRVDAAQEQVQAAEAASAAADAAFCGSARDYVLALDRYGDLLTQTTVTVGDVVTAGQDLGEPGQAATDAAELATTARSELAKAQAELTQAQEDLARLQASASGSAARTTKPASPGTPTPAAPPASVARVQTAQQQLDAALRGTTDTTPLAQAGRQFNSAAVALEMAWLQLFADAGCIPDGQQKQVTEAVAGYTRALQESLASAGYYEGKVDGIYSPATVAAVEALQQAHGLPVTGSMDKASQAALQSELVAKGGAASQAAMADTAALQQTLKLTGYWDGPVDGQWTDELTAALQKAQKDLGVPETGELDAKTIAAFEKAAAKAATIPTPTVTTTVTVTANPTAS